MRFRPHFTMRNLMAVVAILAIDLWVIRVYMGHDTWVDELTLLCALPMANVLLAVGWIGVLRPRARTFAIGFEVLGLLSLATFFAWEQLASRGRSSIIWMPSSNRSRDSPGASSPNMRVSWSMAAGSSSSYPRMSSWGSWAARSP